MEACVRVSAAFVVCPCCVGKVRHAADQNFTETEDIALSYPRSARGRQSLSFDAYVELARAADWHAEVPQQALRRDAKARVEVDRLNFAQDNGYSVFLMQLPEWTTPKTTCLWAFLARQVWARID